MVGVLRPGRLCIGTAPLGGLYGTVTDEAASATLEAAAAGGVSHFDTAPHYGRGLAEERLGAFLSTAESVEGITVSTKVGRTVRSTPTRSPHDVFLGAPTGESVFDFSPGAIRAQLDESRRRLRRGYIDVALVHDPDDHLDDAPRAVEELLRQREAGNVGAVGVGTNRAGVAHVLLDRVDLDVVLLAGRITLLESSGESVARRCAAGGITFLAAGVFQSGILAGGRGDTYDYLPAREHVRRRVAEMQAVCAEHGATLHQVAINHPRRIPGVSSTLVGVREPAEVTAALEAIAVDLPDDLWTAVDEVRARRQPAGGGRAGVEGGSV